MEVKFENGKFLVEANADIFIVPNHAPNLSGILDFAKEDRKAYAEKFCKDNDIIYNHLSDYFVQVWMVSEDLHCDNMQDHASSFEYIGDNYYISGGALKSFIMSSAIDDLQEGQTKLINVNDLKCYKSTRGRYSVCNGEEFKVDLKLNVTAAQTKYRYARFGNFDSVLKEVCY